MRGSLEFLVSRPVLGNIRLEQDLPRDGLAVRGSTSMLGQVFLNLLLNACEAQPAGGEVRVSARREAGRVVAEIADRGPGVPASETARIFEPFYSTKHSTGLGLSICYAIARQHRAELSVAARPGGGAVFRIESPEEPPDA
jgi:signal transduction histidine kinase